MFTLLILLVYGQENGDFYFIHKDYDKHQNEAYAKPILGHHINESIETLQSLPM